MQRLPRAGLGRRRDALSAGRREHPSPIAPAEMIEPLRLAFEVACPPEHAFAVWTARIARLVAGRPHRERRAGPRRSCSSRASAAGSSSARRPGPSTTGARSRSGSRRAGSATCGTCARDRADATEVEIRFVPSRRRARGSRSSTAAGSGWAPRARRGATATSAAGAPLLPHFIRLPPETGPRSDTMAGRDRWRRPLAPGRRTIPGSSRRRPARASSRCIATTRPIRRAGVPGRLDAADAITCARSTTCTPGSRSRATGCRSAPPTSRRPRPRARSRPGAGRRQPVGGWYGLRKGYRGRFGMYMPPLLEALGLAELEHNPRNNRTRAI